MCVRGLITNFDENLVTCIVIAKGVFQYHYGKLQVLKHSF